VLCVPEILINLKLNHKQNRPIVINDMFCVNVVPLSTTFSGACLCINSGLRIIVRDFSDKDLEDKGFVVPF